MSTINYVADHNNCKGDGTCTVIQDPKNANFEVKCQCGAKFSFGVIEEKEAKRCHSTESLKA